MWQVAHLASQAHLKQLVSLVQYHMLNNLQGKARHFIKMMQQAARRGHQDVWRCCQLGELRLQRIAANQHRSAQVGVLPKLRYHRVRLKRKLARGRQQHSAR